MDDGKCYLCQWWYQDVDSLNGPLILGDRDQQKVVALQAAGGSSWKQP